MQIYYKKMEYANKKVKIFSLAVVFCLALTGIVILLYMDDPDTNKKVEVEKATI